jgi:hypothetical protein
MKKSNESRELMDYIRELYKKENIPIYTEGYQILASQIGNYTHDKGMKCSGIKLTIQYMLDHNIDIFGSTSGSVLSYVPKYYQDAKKDYEEKHPKTKSDYTKLTDFILQQYQENGIELTKDDWKFMSSQIKNMISEDKEMTYSGILETLKYLKKFEPDELFSENAKSILSLVPYRYYKAQNYKKETEKIQNEINNFDFDDVVVVHKISKNQNLIHTKIYQEIDISTLV